MALFNIVAGLASIASLVYIVAQFLLRQHANAKQRRADAEAALEELTAQLQSAGQTLPARTDLGFFVMLQLGSMREGIARGRFVAVLDFLILIFMTAVETSEHGTTTGLFALISIVVLFAALVAVLAVVWRLEGQLDSYEKRVTGIWENPVNRRSSGPGGAA